MSGVKCRITEKKGGGEDFGFSEIGGGLALISGFWGT